MSSSSGVTVSMKAIDSFMVLNRNDDNVFLFLNRYGDRMPLQESSIYVVCMRSDMSCQGFSCGLFMRSRGSDLCLELNSHQLIFIGCQIPL